MIIAGERKCRSIA